MSRKKKKRKLSPAMKLGMMLILLEGENLVYKRDAERHLLDWILCSVYPITPRELLDGRKIPIILQKVTDAALQKRGLISKGSKYSRNSKRLTKRGLYRIKQWPEYDEIIVMKVLNDL